MEHFNIGQKIRLADRQEATVLAFVGAGAQGTVYKVLMDNEEKALKWYRRKPDAAFVRNIEKNIADGSPSPLFLWPEALTREQKGGVGYIMPLCPEGYQDFSKFRMAKVRFSSFRAILNAAIALCEAFRLLHAQGLSYQDLNDGGFFVNPHTGDVRICDCDNVCAHGENLGILGKARFMAPEVVRGKSLPGCYTDRFSLAVILFMLFCIDHPFEGINVTSRPCLTEEIERHLFGKDLTFVYDPSLDKNRPVYGLHRNVITMWPLLPRQLRDAFTEQFSGKVISNPPSRMTEMQWSDLLVGLREALVKCPDCGDEAFALPECRCLNSRCAKVVEPDFVAEGSGHRLPLVKGNTLHLGKESAQFAYVAVNPRDAKSFVMKNISATTWNVTTPSGKSISVTPQGFMPIKDGLTINVNSLKLQITKQ